MVCNYPIWHDIRISVTVSCARVEGGVTDTWSPVHCLDDYCSVTVNYPIAEEGPILILASKMSVGAARHVI